MQTKEFLEAVKNDTAMQAELAKATLESVSKVAKKHGFDVSAEDMDKKDLVSKSSVGCVSTLFTVVCTA